MFKRFLLTFALSFCILGASACQQMQETANDADQLATSDSPVTNPTRNEMDAAKSPCDDAPNNEEAARCAKTEFDKVETEMNDFYQKVLNERQSFAEKAASQDKILADKYKKDADNLRAAQKLWLAYRDANCAAEKETYGENQTAYAPFSCEERMTEDRIEDLKLIYENK